MNKLKLVDVDVNPWIKHFEDQAKQGTTSRASFNRHYIVVHPGEKVKKSDTDVKIPQTVSPVQQSVDQAKEEIKREINTDQTLKDIDKTIVHPTSDTTAKCIENTAGLIKGKKRTLAIGSSVLKCKKKARLLSDIFSKK